MKSLATFAAALVFITGCQNEQSSTPDTSVTATVSATPVAFNVAGAPTASLYVPDMFCEFSCVEKVKQVLADQSGVKEVKIDFETKTATVVIDETGFDAEGAIAALVDYQFMDSKLIADQGNTLVSNEVSNKTKPTAVNVSFEK